MNYIINILASLSVVLNTLLGGSYRNTFSARTGYADIVLKKTWAKYMSAFINLLFFFDYNHCEKEYLEEIDTFK